MLALLANQATKSAQLFVVGAAEIFLKNKIHSRGWPQRLARESVAFTFESQTSCGPREPKHRVLLQADKQKETLHSEGFFLFGGDDGNRTRTISLED
ncbi:MAG: hypothetical protein RLZZ600_692 [Actinomycetota bacterium]